MVTAFLSMGRGAGGGGRASHKYQDYKKIGGLGYYCVTCLQGGGNDLNNVQIYAARPDLCSASNQMQACNIPALHLRMMLPVHQQSQGRRSQALGRPALPVVNSIALGPLRPPAAHAQPARDHLWLM